MPRRPSKKSINYFRNFIFGVEDSLVSTVGLLSGIAIAGTPRNTIILSGVVLIFVESFSMGVGSFLSEHTAEEFAKQRATSGKGSIKSSIVMFASYFLAGFIPLAPYLFISDARAITVSVISSLTTLFVLGIASAKFFHGKILRKGFEMLLIGGFAIAIGIIVGSITSNLG